MYEIVIKSEKERERGVTYATNFFVEEELVKSREVRWGGGDVAHGPPTRHTNKMV